MLHLYIMLYIVALTLWLSAFVMWHACEQTDAAWRSYYRPYQFTNRKSNINVI